MSGLTHFERTACTGREQMAAKRKLNCLCFTVFIHKGWQRILSHFCAIDVFFFGRLYSTGSGRMQIHLIASNCLSSNCYTQTEQGQLYYVL